MRVENQFTEFYEIGAEIAKPYPLTDPHPMAYDRALRTAPVSQHSAPSEAPHPDVSDSHTFRLKGLTW